MSKMYICVLDEVSDFIVPCLVGHAVLRHHLKSCEFSHHSEGYELYDEWLTNSFRKCVVSVSQKEFDKIMEIPYSVMSWENTTLGGKPSCVTIVVGEEVPNVLKYARLWKPKI